MLLNFCHYTLERLDISTQCDLQTYSKIGELVAKVRFPSKY